MTNGLFECKHSCARMHRSEENISMTLKNIMEKLKTALSLGWHRLQGRPILFHAIMENGAVFYRLPISAFIQRGFDVKRSS